MRKREQKITAVLNMDVLILKPSIVAFNSSTVALGTFAPLVMGLISTCSFLSGSSSSRWCVTKKKRAKQELHESKGFQTKDFQKRKSLLFCFSLKQS